MTYRVTQKEILISVIALHEILTRVLIRLRDGMPNIEAIYGRVDMYE